MPLPGLGGHAHSQSNKGTGKFRKNNKAVDPLAGNFVLQHKLAQIADFLRISSIAESARLKAHGDEAHGDVEPRHFLDLDVRDLDASAIQTLK